MLPPPLNVRDIVPPAEPESEIPREYMIKRAALDSLVEALRSLLNWSMAGRPGANGVIRESETRGSKDDMRESIDPSIAESNSRETPIPPSPPIVEDDPAHLEKEKARKTALANGIRQF